ncbi:2-octaprenyl-3-methyl-6-methoxy-1,4-benzoquinol hydroxylase [Rickettsiella grylli]|uniref:2-polyprenyl-3-methyl-6-methoxy-1,4-benzoquinone monooxygenase n=1 Tax=Rickettsiella grylli TaxID=59196 RepID=UPI0008FD8B96|nr:2-polyprenyl-3-methyl-6-methoxy-1,4-benzoquinone monooxygenase [Rickettsiella grylli]OJA00493.1 2-octaprenyl-3-methyl-6-methoxy-1,4-benzoquinol hydroxylase [Rickettsiella grylli]
MRCYSFWDRLIFHVEEGLNTIQQRSNTAVYRPSPAEKVSQNGPLSKKESELSGRLMRINHMGEVCAQALYRGQAFTARSQQTKQKLKKAAKEEMDHLHWCQQRIHELDTQVSYLNPFWFIGALLIGLTAGLGGDKLSLGFLAETEQQVERHLHQHLQKLPLHDKKTRAIVEQMRQEESEHALIAEQAGAAPLPIVIQWSMHALAQFMVRVAYRI